MAILLALIGSVVVGTGDFLGGVASRRSAAARVVAGGFVAGTVVLVVAAMLAGGSPTPGDVGWGAASGVGAVIGVFSLYRGFMSAHMGVVSPVAAVTGGVLPVLVGLARGERPSPAVATGIVGAALAIGMISAGRGGGGSVWAGIRYGLGAGAGFGLLLGLLSLADPSAGLWPVAASRVASTVLILSVVAAIGGLGLPAPGARLLALGAGALTAAGNAAFFVALRFGLVSVVSILYAMFPAATILLARLVYGERFGRLQQVGIAVALVATALIAAG